MSVYKTGTAGLVGEGKKLKDKCPLRRGNDTTLLKEDANYLLIQKR